MQNTKNNKIPIFEVKKNLLVFKVGPVKWRVSATGNTEEVHLFITIQTSKNASCWCW